ncbi:MAG: hypothetical protein AMDU2_EPLC00006G0595 [Thermoplasmatales archaeon E-plasma]|jgi:hypothetical protein|nr:MAG: hypothetical protein AMDU2_EPLC00006G0595 [Thermoplasmatales archaeon E-plasma]
MNNDEKNSGKEKSDTIDFEVKNKTQSIKDSGIPTKKKPKGKTNSESSKTEQIPEEVKVEKKLDDTKKINEQEPPKKSQPKIEVPAVKKKKSWWGRGKKSGSSETRTVVEIKTLGDIPPIVEVRKLIGNGDKNEGTVRGFNLAKADIARSFNTVQKPGESNRKFLVRILRESGIEIPDEAYVDNTALKNAMKNSLSVSESNKIDALKKLAFFYVDYYEKAKFSNEVYSTDDDIIDRLMDLYNYLDVAKLYYPSHDQGRR